MTDKVVSLFDRSSLSKPGTEPASPSVTELKPYRAAFIERPGKQVWSIRIHYSNGVVEQITYSRRKYEVSVNPDCLDIVFTTGAAMLTGKNLRLLLDDLQEERVRSIQPFDPAIHKTPKDDEPIIHNIEWASTNELIKHSTLATK